MKLRMKDFLISLIPIKKYRKKFVEAMKNKDKKELNRIKSDMQRHHLSAKEQRRIYESAYKKYLQER